MKAGRIVALVFSCIFGLLGLVLLIGGVVAAVAVGVARDDDGFFRTHEFRLASPTAAITSESLDLGGAPGDAEWLTQRGDFATVSLQIESIANGKELFAGIGPTSDVEAYPARLLATVSTTSTTRSGLLYSAAWTARRRRRLRATSRSGPSRSPRHSPLSCSGRSTTATGPSPS